MRRTAFISLSLIVTSLATPTAFAAPTPLPLPPTIPSADALWKKRPAAIDELVVTYRVNNKPVVMRADADTRSEVASVLQAAGTAPISVEWNATVRMTSNDSYASYLWGLANSTAELSWPTSTGSGIIVAVVDTGVAPHVDLEGRLMPGRSILDGVTTTNASDDNGHGTHVAGTIAASANNARGVAGVAPDARILPVKVLDANGSGSLADVAAGIVFAADSGARVINLSLGSSYASSTIQSASDYAFTKGALVVAAAGNGGPTAAPSYPAADATDKILAVAAHDQSNQPASFTQSGAYIDISAPGVSILSMYLNDGYAFMNGTSMATPHVAAAAALLWGANPSLTPAAVRAALMSGAVDIFDTGRDLRTGAGRLDVQRALAAIQPTTTPPPETTTAPAPTTTVPVPVTTTAPAPTTTAPAPTTTVPVPVTTTPPAPTTTVPVPVTTTPPAPTTTVPVPVTTTPPAPTQPLPAPKAIRSKIWGTNVEVTASLVPAARSYRVTRNGTVVATAARLPAFVDAQRALNAGTYSYTIQGVAADGTIGTAATTRIVVAPPAVPKVLSVSTSSRRMNVTLATMPKTVSSWQLMRADKVVAQMSARSTKAAFILPVGTHTFTIRATSATGVSAQAEPFTVKITR
jgi:serine protease